MYLVLKQYNVVCFESGASNNKKDLGFGIDPDIDIHTGPTF